MSLPGQRAAARVAYGGERSQFGELRLPRGEAAAGGWPVACVVHGGYYRARYDLRHISHLAAALAQAGIATWSIEYRRLGEPGGGWPGTFLDVGAGLDALRQLASRYALDLTRLITLGHSAGGQLALWLASRPHLPAGTLLSTPTPLPAATLLSVATPLRVVGTLALAPVADLARGSALGLSNGVVDDLLGGTPRAVPERYALTSPAERLPLGVPQLVVHGTADTAVPFELSEGYVRAAQAAGDPAELIPLPGVDHFDIIDPRTSAFAATRQAAQRLLGLAADH